MYDEGAFADWCQAGMRQLWEFWLPTALIAAVTAALIVVTDYTAPFASRPVRGRPAEVAPPHGLADGEFGIVRPDGAIVAVRRGAKP